MTRLTPFLVAATLLASCEPEQKQQASTATPKPSVEVQIKWTIASAPADGTSCESGALATFLRLTPDDGSPPTDVTPTCAAGSANVSVPAGLYQVSGHLTRAGVVGADAHTTFDIGSLPTLHMQSVTLDLIPPGSAPLVDAGGGGTCTNAKLGFVQPLTPVTPVGVSMCGKSYAQGVFAAVKFHDQTHGPPLSNLPNSTKCNASLELVPSPTHIEMFGGEIEIALADVACKPTKVVAAFDFTYGSGPPYPSTLSRIAAYKGTDAVAEMTPDAHAPTATLDFPADTEVVVLQRPFLGSSDVTHLVSLEFQ